MSRYLLIILIISNIILVIASSTASPKSAALRKRRDPTCDNFYGNPKVADCQAAKNKILHWEAFHSPSSSDSYDFLMGAFEFFTVNAKHNPAFPRCPRAYLPVTFTSGGCEVAMVMSEGLTDMDSPIDAYERTSKLNKRCVQDRNQGGFDHIGVHSQIYIYVYALDSDYSRLQDRLASCSQTSSSGQNPIDCSNLHNPPISSSSTSPETSSSSETQPSSSSSNNQEGSQQSPHTTCSKGYTKQSDDCCEGFSLVFWRVWSAVRVAVVFGIKGVGGGDMVGWCQRIDSTV